MPRILIAEDDDRLRSSLAAALADEYLICVASSGRQAVEFLRRQTVDVVLLDMVMADGDGYTVLSHVSGMQPRPYVVVLSGLSRATDAVKVMKLGANDYLVKPCRVKTLRQAIRGVLHDEPVPVG